MNKLFKTIITILVFLLVCAVAGVVGYWCYFRNQWPWWLALSMAAGVFGLYFLLLFVKKYLIRRREKRFVQRIVDHGDVLEEGARPEAQAILDLESGWRTSMEILKKSHLRKQGNPLYVLPWYLAMGESGVGKSTMLVNSGVASSFTELEDVGGKIGATRNCDWVFFDAAVVLDTAGRYSVPLASNQQLNEWKRFLLLLSKARRKEPLNGIILFVAADDLLSANHHSLRKKAQVMRNRIHSLMRTMGYKIPVTVMVTKMDTLAGFSEFTSLLSESQRRQSMGGLKALSEGWEELLAKTLTNLDDDLQKLRLQLVASEDGRKPSFFSLPSQIQSLGVGLHSFLSGIFVENSYQETPVIQGVFFGSGNGAEEVTANFLPKQAVPSGFTSTMGSAAAVFGHDFFSLLLPGNRKRLEPVKELLLWRMVTRKLSMVAIVCLTLFGAGLIGASYMHNTKVLKMLPARAEKVSYNDVGSNAALVDLEKMRLDIVKLEEQNNSWKLPFQIYTSGNEAEEAYKAQYCQLFESALLSPMENGFEKVVDSISFEESPEVYGNYISYATEQINYLLSHMAGKKPTEFKSFNKVSSSILAIKNPDLISEVGDYFTDLNGSYLAWNLDESDNRARLDRLRDTLKTLLTKNRGEVSWLYTAAIVDAPAVTLADFWRNHQVNSKGAPTIPGAFTENGRKDITDFLHEIKVAGIDSAIYDELLKGYENSYPRQFAHWWQLFATHFMEGELRLDSDVEWREAAILMSSVNNPFFTLLKRMDSELQALQKANGDRLPGWGDAIIALGKIRQIALTDKNNKQQNPSLNARVTSEENKLVVEALGQVDPAKRAAMDAKLKMAQAWNQYQDGLISLATITPYKEKGAKEFLAWFKLAKGSGQEKSIFEDVYNSWSALKTLGNSTLPSELMWKIAYGPFNFLQDYAARDTALVLQEKWQEDVLASVVNVDPQKLSDVLFAKKEGVVWKYMQDYADPFVAKTVSGYRPRTYYGRSLKFSPGFYGFVNQAMGVVINRKPSYTVTMETKPIEVNSDAESEPFYATVSMSCAKDSYSLENDNFPRKLALTWYPEKCGDVALTIGLPNGELNKVWDGKLAFANFLKQFKTGSYKFLPEDFPNQSEVFKDYGITYIQLTYGFSGADEVIQLLSESPSLIPEEVITVDGQLSAQPYQSPSSHQVLPRPINSGKAADTNQQEHQNVVMPQQLSPKKTEQKNEFPDDDYHHNPWILEQDPQWNTVQLMSLSSMDGVAKGFAMLSDDKERIVLSKVVNGRDWYILCSGLFKKKQAAQDYLNTLPASIKNGGAVRRSFAGLKREIKDTSDQ